MCRCGRAGSLAATPGEKLLELLRPSVGTPRRHSTAACAPAQPQRPAGFVYCPSDALPYCPPSRIAPPRPIMKVCESIYNMVTLGFRTKFVIMFCDCLRYQLQPPPQQIQPVQPQPPPVPQRTTATVAPTPLPVPPPAPPRRSSPQPPRRVPPPTPPRPPTTTPAPPQTDPNGNRRTVAPVQPQPRLDCNRNPQPLSARRAPPPQRIPDAATFTPAPLPPQNTVQPIKRSPSSGSNISVRQDSNVSSDSFSQTSSPSYTTKTMEAPLLPHQHVNKSLNAKIARGLLLKEQQDRDSGNGSITKSMSTPASLQTIVRFQNGSNMSLHHRVSYNSY